jgi:hypothetical protein
MSAGANVLDGGAELTELAERGKRARRRRSERDYPAFEEVSAPLERFVRAYALADEPARAEARAFAKTSRDLGMWFLWGSGNWTREFERALLPELLDLALASLSLEDAQLDPHNTLMALGLAWHRAVRAGVDPRPAFERAALISSTGDGGFADLLRGFERSAFFAEDVRPCLENAELEYEAE